MMNLEKLPHFVLGPTYLEKERWEERRLSASALVIKIGEKGRPI